MSDNVRALPGNHIPNTNGAPNPDLIDIIEKLLVMAKEGQLQSFYGTGFTSDGLRSCIWLDCERDYYKILGALESLKLEFVERRKENA